MDAGRSSIIYRLPSSFAPSVVFHPPSFILLTILLAACQSGSSVLPSSSSLAAMKETAVAVVSPVIAEIQVVETPSASELPQATASVSLRQAQVAVTGPAPLASATATPFSPPASDAQAQIGQRMLKLINRDREANNLSDLAWDEFAAQVGRSHANDMATFGYFSHLDQQGRGPDLRYALAGGSEAEFENLYSLSLKYSNGTAGTIQDWDSVMSEAEQQLMNSPGHRAQLLAPDHTHVGVSLAWNAQTGELRLAQEFLNRYAKLSALPRQAAAGDHVEVTATLISNVTQPLINLAWEPVPTPQSPAQLGNGQVYQSPAQVLEAISVQIAGNALKARITLLPQGKAGYYHIRLWAKRAGRDVLLADPVIFVP